MARLASGNNWLIKRTGQKINQSSFIYVCFVVIFIVEGNVT